jgi:hypothetical protein
MSVGTDVFGWGFYLMSCITAFVFIPHTDCLFSDIQKRGQASFRWKRSLCQMSAISIYAYHIVPSVTSAYVQVALKAHDVVHAV